MTKDILVLEGEWDPNPKQTTSVRSAMQFLQDITSRGFHHRWVATTNDFFFYLQKARHKRFEIIYLAFHGEENLIYLGDFSQSLSLDEIATGAEGYLAGKIVHFGSCSVLNLPTEELMSFKRQIGARHISGYRNDVDFLDSAFFDLALFAWLGEYERTGHVASRMEKEYPGLYNRLGFVMV